jgi:predicted negative regulator of RcsB-dependent stress response
VKREEREFLKAPDEFVLWTTRISDWARANRQVVIGVGVVCALAAVAAGGLRWQQARRTDAASEAFRVARGRFAAGEIAAAVSDFDALARDYPGTSFGRLAALYRGHARLRQGDFSGAAAAYQEYLASPLRADYLEQLALLNLAQAEEQGGDPTRARTTLEKAAGIPGPYRVPALLGTARIAQAAGHPDIASAAYRRILESDPNPDVRAIAERNLSAASAPPETARPTP